MTEPSKTPSRIERISAYLRLGGLFNPELANHDAVSDLLIDCRTELTAARDEARRNAEQYSELIMAVARKFPNESRHETALRYIRNAEQDCQSGDAGDANATRKEAK